MKKRKIISIIAFILLFFVIFFPRQTYVTLWFTCANIQGLFAEQEAIWIERGTRKKNTIAANEWVREAFGATVSEVVKLKYDGRGTGWSDCSTFMIETPFASGALWVSSKDQSISGGLSVKDDPRFLHLYSNWVKKQVGIEDENVELKFGEAKKGARMVGQPPYIDFKAITSIDNLEEQIYEHTHNLYVKNVAISNFATSDINEVLNTVKKYEANLKPYVFKGGDNELWVGVNLKDDVNDKNDPYSYDICFNYSKNENKYFKYYKNRTLDNNKSDYVIFD